MKHKVLGQVAPLCKVSNPWREAIEGALFYIVSDGTNVSNPWREAIEGVRCCCKSQIRQVSNPWREAIEDVYAGRQSQP